MKRRHFLRAGAAGLLSAATPALSNASQSTLSAAATNAEPAVGTGYRCIDTNGLAHRLRLQEVQHHRSDGTTRQFSLVFTTPAERRLDGLYWLQREGAAAELVLLQADTTGITRAHFSLLQS